jgi:uncharacterized protein YjiS (DUF1127 family)
MERDVGARLVDANGAAFGIVTGLISRAGRMLAQHLLERAYRRAEKKLMELDDRMLRDIGLTRSEITSAVRSSEQERTQCKSPNLDAATFTDLSRLPSRNDSE